MPSFEPPEVP
jgi:hypothetical protein